MKTDLVTTRFDVPAEEGRSPDRAIWLLRDAGAGRARQDAGISRWDDAQEVLHEAETEDVRKLAGVTGAAEAYLSMRHGSF